MIILVAKKFIPKFPMSVLLMVLGALATAIFHIDRFGVKLLPHVDKGLPDSRFLICQLCLRIRQR